MELYVFFFTLSLIEEENERDQKNNLYYDINNTDWLLLPGSIQFQVYF